MNLREILEEEFILESKKKVAEGNKYKEGRERLVTAIYNKVKKMGGKVNKKAIKDYVVHMYKLWESRNPKVQWLLDLEDKASSLGFNPRDYKDQKPGDSAGKGGKGSPEYNGRAYFFVAVMENFAKHFMNKYNKKKNKDKIKEEISMSFKNDVLFYLGEENKFKTVNDETNKKEVLATASCTAEKDKKASKSTETKGGDDGDDNCHSSVETKDKDENKKNKKNKEEENNEDNENSEEEEGSEDSEADKEKEEKSAKKEKPCYFNY